jgi:putative phage-type endonuclease
MPLPTRIPARQGSPEWLEARRAVITSTDLSGLLGVSPWKVEADVAAEKAGERVVESTIRMRIGTALEPLIASEYEAQTGSRLRRFHGLHVHPTIPWAAASPDYRVAGQRLLVETKWTAGRGRYADGLPQDVEAQVRWQLGCLRWKQAEVAVLIGGEELRRYPLEHDEAVFAGMVEVAADFRARLAAGGPFAQSVDSIRARYPADDGSELVADEELEAAVRELHRLRRAREDVEHAAEAIEVALKSRMADAARLVGDGWAITWKQGRDSRLIDWQSIAEGLLRSLPEEQREALVGIHTNVKPGSRPFRLTWKGDAP